MQRPIPTYLIGASILCLGMVYCMHHGYHGLHMLDSGIVFEGAWRLLSGDRFVTDFDTPNGFVPMQIQMVFFKVFGVNWWAYRLHAGVFNGLFGVIVFWILRMSGLRNEISGILGMLSCVIFYPPMGVPYMEQHAFFFVALGVALTIKAARWGSKAHILLALVPVSWVLAILSKQNPGLLAPLLCLIAWVGYARERRFSTAFKGLAFGMPMAIAAGILVLGQPIQLIGENWEDFWRHFWEMPGEIGKARLAEWNYGPMKTLRNLAWYPFQILLPSFHFQFRHLLLVPLYLTVAEWAWSKYKKTGIQVRYPIKHLVLGLSLVATCSLFMRLSQNQTENGLPFAFLSIGLGLQFWSEWFKSGPIGRQWPVASGWAWRAFAVFLLGTCIFAAIRFDLNVNQPRMVLELETGKKEGVLGPKQRGIDGLEFQAAYDQGSNDVGAFLTWLRAQEGEVGYFGDMRFLLAMAGKADHLPCLWLHPGLTMPGLDAPDMRAFDLELLQELQSAHIRSMIFEHKQRVTYMKLQWECLPETAAFIDSRTVRHENLGGFSIWTLRAD